MQKIILLGSTGSIGRQTLEVIRLNSNRFQIEALTAHRNVELLYAQCIEFEPHYAFINKDFALLLAAQLKKAGSKTQVLSDETDLISLAIDPQSPIVVAAMVGAVGLKPVLAAARAGKKILLANKESLVMAGELLIAEIKKNHGTLLPVDSEHNAILQCLPRNFEPGISQSNELHSVILTASGGPFRNLNLKKFSNITAEQALQHPNWNMGAKISIDSATMMNKGLEVIEAFWLFNVSNDQIEVVVHPQSIIHSMVRFMDGSIIAQLGMPDMRIPISSALAWPQRIPSGASHLDFLKIKNLDFEPVDKKRFPCLDLCYQALKMGGTAPTILNAANEIAVEAFLNKQISFPQIFEVNAKILASIPIHSLKNIEQLFIADKLARENASRLVTSCQLSSVSLSNV